MTANEYLDLKAAALKRCFSRMNPPQLDAVTTVTGPVLVLAGTDDVIPEEHTKELAAHLKNSTLLILDGEDHGSYIQGSRIAGDLLLEFLKINRY